MKRPIRLLAAVVGLALVAGACGDDDEAETTETTTAPAAQETTTPSETSGAETSAPAAGGDADLSGQSLTVGSANFPESVLLAEIYGGALGARGADISIQPNIGSREIYYAAIESGEIDLLPEYTNSLL